MGHTSFLSAAPRQFRTLFDVQILHRTVCPSFFLIPTTSHICTAAMTAKMASSSRSLLTRSLLSPTMAPHLAAVRPLSTSALAHQHQQNGTAPATSSSSSTDVGTPYLPWDRYLNMRKQRRIAGMITTVPSTILAGVTSGSYFLTQEIDPTSSPIAGIDPVYVYALLTLGCTGAYASDA